MKKILSIALVLLLAVSVLCLAGCQKGGSASGDVKGAEEPVKVSNTVDITYSFGKGNFTVSVPKTEDGSPKYVFVEEKPEGISTSASFYLVTDTAMLGFLTGGMSYNTSKDYKEKFGETKATFDGYLEFIDSELFNKSYLPGLEQFEINGRKALRYFNRAGGGGDYEYYGYFYLLGVDDIYPGSRAEIVANYKVDERPKEIQEFDQETLDIINSLKITPVEAE